MAEWGIRGLTGRLGLPSKMELDQLETEGLGWGIHLSGVYWLPESESKTAVLEQSHTWRIRGRVQKSRDIRGPKSITKYIKKFCKGRGPGRCVEELKT